jgi:uncharacterized protein
MLALRCVNTQYPMPNTLYPIKILIFIGFLFLVFLFDIFILERYFVRFKEYEIYSNKIDKSFDGYKIAIVSDLHYGFLTPMFWVKWVFSRINEYQPNLIVGIGDYVKKRNVDTELLEIWTELLSLQAIDGTYFINGNHDHWANHDLSLQLLENSQKSVRNRFVTIDKGSAKILVAGIGDYWEDPTEIDQALKDSSHKYFRIVLAHNPDSSNQTHNETVDLFISGHTHGGQVRIPILERSPILPVKDKNFDQGFKKNRFGEDVFISPGLGWSILPIRFFCPAEVSILILKSKKKESF